MAAGNISNGRARPKIPTWAIEPRRFLRCERACTLLSVPSDSGIRFQFHPDGSERLGRLHVLHLMLGTGGQEYDPAVRFPRMVNSRYTGRVFVHVRG
jgi:hypothetical protein